MIIVCLKCDTGTNEVSGTSEFFPLEPPVTGAGKSSLGEIILNWDACTFLKVETWVMA